MPYITKDRRDILDGDIASLAGSLNRLGNKPGDLNYTIFSLLINALQDKGESYATYNELIGVMEACKTEFYMRRVIKYEDKKIAENGDV